MRRVADETEKLALRAALLSRRSALASSECQLRSRAIQYRALRLPPYAAARCIALYSPAQNEVGTEEILKNSLSEGRKVFYPRSVDAQFYHVSSIDDLSAGQYGILEPTGGKRLAARDWPDLVIFVPGVAFDSAGNRLGRGRGWYDRVLTSLQGKAVLVALAYDFQVVGRVPTEAWDRRVHYVVTETKLIDCGAAEVPLGRASQ